MPDFVVGPTGLPQRRYKDWRAGLVDRWRVAYGDAADTSPETPDGLQIDTITLETTQIGDGIQSAYANSFLRTSEGVSVDLHLDLFARRRLAARATAVDAIWWGTPGTVVWNGVGTGPVASVLTTGTGNGDRYAVAEAGTIPSPDDDGALVVLQIPRPTIVGHDYGLEFDAFSVFAPAVSTDPVETAEIVAAEIEAQTGYTSTGISDGRTGSLVIVSGKGSEVVQISNDSTDPSEMALWGGVELSMAAEETGPQQVLSETLITIETPAAGLEGVVNLLDGTPGRNLETDPEFKARHLSQINVGGRGTPARIRAALLDQDPEDREPLELEAARVINNPRGEQAVVEGRTLPAHSFECIVLGDATDEEVAAVIFDQTTAGMQSYGEIEVEVTDEVGGTHTVAFTRATELYLHLELNVTAGEGFPSTGDPEAAITEAVVADLQTRLQLGQDFHRVAPLAVAIVTIPGITTGNAEADATAAPGDPPTLVGADITVGANEILRVDSSRITVNIT